jgi:uncharacterized zinc-type alcohol dehydrogenase-like protein
MGRFFLFFEAVRMLIMKTRAYAAYNSVDALKPFTFEYGVPKSSDVVIDILYCGICHSDVHSARNEWTSFTQAVYPMVPGHEIIGVVREVGEDVKKFKKGDIVGVGCLVGSCRHCSECDEGLEQFCDEKVLTYNAYLPQLGRTTYGGYAEHIVVDEHFVLSIPQGMELAKTAPLLCAGITVYSPLRHWNVKPGDRVGIVGLGGLGHVAVKIAQAMGAHVVVFTTSANKAAEAKALGADEVVISKDDLEMSAQKNRFRFILSTVAASHDLDPYVALLKRDGVIVFIGLPSENHPPPSMGNFIFGRRSMAGSLIGGVQETQEMLEFCAKHNITADIEMIAMQDINVAFDRMLKNDVKYRFVIDMSTLHQ